MREQQHCVWEEKDFMHGHKKAVYVCVFLYSVLYLCLCGLVGPV